MIYNLSKKLAIKFEQKGYILAEEVDFIGYGFFSVISKLLYGFISLLIGLGLGCAVEAVCFYFAFLFIKKYAGGIHASTEYRCFIASTISIICSIFCVFLSMNYMLFGHIIFALSLLSSIAILRFAPIPAKEKPLDNRELKQYSKISVIRMCVLIVVASIVYSLDLLNIVFSICVAIILESILILMGKVGNIKAGR